MVDYTGIPEALNERIKFIRLIHDYKQSDIANKLCISRVTYTKYETGDRAIPTEVIKGLAYIYSITTDFILGISAKPQYVDYSNYYTKLSPRATEQLQLMFENFNNSLFGVNALLESKYACRIFHFLGLLLKFPNNYDDLLMESEENIYRYGTLLAYKEDFTETLNIPSGMFGIEDKDLRVMDDIYVPDMFETYFHLYLTKFINETRESTDTKKAFLDELKRAYYEYVKKDITDMEESYDQLIEAQELDNKTE